tara:strand:- start:1240 stop:1461 length:222 start_codon:yes stop_codon:yes gene_type:complete
MEEDIRLEVVVEDALKDIQEECLEYNSVPVIVITTRLGANIYNYIAPDNLALDAIVEIMEAMLSVCKDRQARQ